MEIRLGAVTRASLSVLVGITIGFSCLCGCKPSAEKLAAQRQRVAAEVDQTIQKAQALAVQGQAVEAVRLLDKALGTSRFACLKERLFRQKLDILLSQNSDAAAADFVLASWKKDRALAQDAFARLRDFYQQRNAPAALQTWCNRILALSPQVPVDVKRQVFGWKLTAAWSQGDASVIASCIDDLTAALKTPEAVALLDGQLSALTADGKQALARIAIAHLESRKNLPAAFAELAALQMLKCVLAAEGWDQFPSAFQVCVARLPEDELLKIMRTTFATLQKKNQRPLVEQSSKLVAFSATAKTAAANFAARIWVECGVAADKQVLPERLEALLVGKISPIQVGNLFDRYFYDMVNDPALIKKLCALGEKILAVCSDENTVNNVKVKVLDGAFIVENYDLAVQMLEKGIPGKDKTWHEMSLPKVKAHRALAQKNPREAVKYFREFMNAWISSNQEEEYDPTSGIAYSREWILGRNANRIAGILDSIPDKEEADKARAEAKKYFKVAIEKAKVDAEATRLIKEETKDMGL